MGGILYLKYRLKFWIARRPIFALIFTLTFIVVAILSKELFWKIYLVLPHHPEKAWMDTREQALIIKHLQAFKETNNQRSSVMLEYGPGGSTFVFSNYVNRYVGIEHNLNYCRLLERMAMNQANHTTTITYMKTIPSGFVEANRFKQTGSQANVDSSIDIYCVPEEGHLVNLNRFWRQKKPSTYTMYKNYVDFVSIYLPNILFDFVLIDGRARPQVAYQSLKQLNGDNAKVFVHDWNARRVYHIIKDEFYDVVDQQIESNQPGGGGLVVLQKKPEVTGKASLDSIQWKTRQQPSWWI